MIFQFIVIAILVLRIVSQVCDKRNILSSSNYINNFSPSEIDGMVFGKSNSGILASTYSSGKEQLVIITGNGLYVNSQEMCDIWRYSLGQWQLLYRQTDPNIAPLDGRTDFAIAIHPANDVIFLYGGKVGSNVKGELYSFTVSTRVWMQLSTEKQFYGHSLVFVTVNSKYYLVVLGGYASTLPNDFQSNGIVYCAPDGYTSCTSISYPNSNNLERAYAFVHVNDNFLYVFGGQTRTDVTNRMIKIELLKDGQPQQNKIKVNSFQNYGSTPSLLPSYTVGSIYPGARKEFGAISLTPDYFIIFGGNGYGDSTGTLRYLNDVFLADITSSTSPAWKVLRRHNETTPSYGQAGLSDPNNFPSPRSNSVLALAGTITASTGKIMMYGGYGSTTTSSSLGTLISPKCKSSVINNLLGNLNDHWNIVYDFPSGKHYWTFDGAGIVSTKSWSPVFIKPGSTFSMNLTSPLSVPTPGTIQARVLMNGRSCTLLSLTSSVLTCTVPLNLASEVSVSVNLTSSIYPASPINTSPLNPLISFKAYIEPILTSVSILSAPTTGGNNTVIITGENMFFHDCYPISISFVSMAVPSFSALCANVTLLSNNSISCIVPAFNAPGLARIRASIVGQTIDSYQDFQYQNPIIYGTTDSDSLKSGDLIKINGENFGFCAGSQCATVSVTVMSKVCTNPIIVSNYLITCNAPAGFGENIPVTVSVNGISASGSASVSYLPPIVSSVTPDQTTWKAGLKITVIADNMNTNSNDLKVELVSYYNKNVSDYHDCINPSYGPGSYSVQCTLPPGLDYSERFAVRLRSLRMSLPVYPPEITSMKLPDRFSTAGGVTQILGTGFTGTINNVLIGSLQSSDIIKISSSEVSFRYPPSVGKFNITIIRNGFASPLFEGPGYELPIVSSISPAMSEASPGQSFTIIGKNFGFINNNLVVSMLPVDEQGSAVIYNNEQCIWTADNVVSCTFPDQWFRPTLYNVRVTVGGQQSSQNVTYQNTNANRPPEGFDGYYEFDENVITLITFNVTDPDNDQLTIQLTSLPTKGQLFQYNQMNPNNIGDRTTTIVTDLSYRLIYKPNLNVNGRDNFTFIANDPRLFKTKKCSIHLDIRSVNQAPSRENSQTQIVSMLGDQKINITLKAIDPEDSMFIYEFQSLPKRGSIKDAITGQEIRSVPYRFSNGSNIESALVTYEPVIYESGNSYASFNWTAYDSMGYAMDTPVTTVINVAFVNHEPIVHNGYAKTMENQPVLLTLNASDVDNQALTITFKKWPSLGTLREVKPDGTEGAPVSLLEATRDPSSRKIWYVPSKSKNGIDEFEWVAKDEMNTESSIKAVFKVEIKPVNDPPKFEFTEPIMTLNYPWPKKATIDILMYDIDEQNTLLLSSDNVPQRGSWSAVDRGATISITEKSFYRLPVEKVQDSESNDGSFVFRTQLYMEQDSKGGGYPYANFSLALSDSQGGAASNSLTVTVLLSCPVGDYNAVWTTSGAACQKCPEGAICSREGDFKPYNQRGYFPTGDGVFIRCFPEEACPAQNGSSFNLNGGFSCGPGYVGYKCGQCNMDYYRSGSYCYKCPDKEVFNPAVMITIGICALTLVFAFVYMVRKVDAGFIGITLTFYQTISIFQTFKLTWPTMVVRLYEIISAVNFNIELAAPECLLNSGKGSYEVKYYVTLAFPVAFLGAILFLILCDRVSIYAKYLRLKRETGESPHASQLIINMYDKTQFIDPDEQPTRMAVLVNIYIMFLKIMYLMLTKKALELFDCSPDASGKSTFEAEPDRKCYTEDWWSTLLPYSVASVIFYLIGLPLLLGTLNYYRIKIKQNIPIGEREKWQKFVLQVTYKEKREFKDNFDFWEVVILLRKLLFVLCQLFFTDYALFQATLIIVLFQCALSVQLIYKPYVMPSLNKLEGTTLFASIIILVAGILAHYGEFGSTQKEALGYVVLLIVIFASMAVTWVVYSHFRIALNIFLQHRRELKSNLSKSNGLVCDEEALSNNLIRNEDESGDSKDVMINNKIDPEKSSILLSRDMTEEV